MEDIMQELELKYGCNPNQKPSRIYMEKGATGSTQAAANTPVNAINAASVA